MPVEPKNAQGRKIIIIAIFGSIGAVWDVLAAAILFHNYSFFESVVVCLLVMILSTVATVRADFELWSGIFSGEDEREGDTAKSRRPGLLDSFRAHLRVLFYAVAFLMALVKLILTLVG